MDMVDVIMRKRDGGTLSAHDIQAVIDGYVGKSIPDYQMSALLMAIMFRGLDIGETLTLTNAMVKSGDVMDMSSIGRRIVDKHPTGGVGDKVSIALGPIVAACGVPLGKMSGRGLGHTGGTLDKLESIPGYRVELTRGQFLSQVAEVGCAIAGQTGDVVPADKQLYALRDVTATVESIPLIAASIMSKKIASGADAIVLDVKVGSGAFMKSLEDARQLADIMISIGEGAGRDVKVLLTDMSTPLGNAVGNALEILEVVELLHDGGPSDLRELVITAAGVLLSLSDLEVDEEEGRLRARHAIATGTAYETYRRWIKAQGGNPDARLELAPVQHTVLASTPGVVEELDALVVGQAAAALGAGRKTKDDVVDHAVGVQLHTHVGARIAAGEPIVTVYARDEDSGCRAAKQVEDCTRIVSASASRVPRNASVILERRG
ncbi:MAG: thymidine phosphorylase [Thermoleophilia bacterium]|nr:thymidine phosphorylase [Thermoleophilia bacterium]